MAGRHLRHDPAPSTARRVWWVVGAFVVGVLAGGGVTLALMEADDATVESGGGEVVASSGGAATATPDPGPITIAFVGDINAEGSLSTRLEGQAEDFVGPFSSILHEADLAVGNVEAAIATGGSPIDKDFTFRAPPSILDALELGGIDVVSLANNHGMDYGSEGLEETLAAKAARDDGMVIGIGADEDDAYAPYTAEIGGHTVAVIAATQVIDGDLIASWTASPSQPGVASAKKMLRLVEEVERARTSADTVVVFLHWGVERETCPSVIQQDLARTLTEAGADIVVGSHAHRVQSGGMLGDAFVGYGLGNFLFGAVGEESAKTGVLSVTVDGREIVDYRWDPGTIVDRVPTPLEGEAADEAIAEWNELRGCTGLAP